MLNTFCIFINVRSYDRCRRMLTVTIICRYTPKFIQNVAKSLYVVIVSYTLVIVDTYTVSFWKLLTMFEM